jgi:hypothetical protein
MNIFYLKHLHVFKFQIIKQKDKVIQRELPFQDYVVLFHVNYVKFNYF